MQKNKVSLGLMLISAQLIFGCSAGFFGSSGAKSGGGDANPTSTPPGGTTSGGTTVGGITAGGITAAGGTATGGTATGGVTAGDPPGSSLPDVPIGSGGTTLIVKACSAPLAVQGLWNPYLAGSLQSINYNAGAHCVDTPAMNAPPPVPLASPDCLLAGSKFYFNVGGTIDHGGASSNADGVQSDTEWHAKGALFGKSNMRAPLNAMVGVFLEADSPDAKPAPATLDFATLASREQLELHPALRQVFFIGDGKTASGQYQKIVVPDGAARFFFATWDSFEWCDNSGSLSGQVYWQAP